MRRPKCAPSRSAAIAGLVERRVVAGQRHSELLLPMIPALLAETGDASARSTASRSASGPGSFTGLRIACGVAQGLGARRRTAASSAFRRWRRWPRRLAIARWRPAQVIAALDARMREVYVAAYEYDGMRLARVASRRRSIAPEAAPLPPGTRLVRRRQRLRLRIRRCASGCAGAAVGCDATISPTASADRRAGAAAFCRRRGRRCARRGAALRAPPRRVDDAPNAPRERRGERRCSQRGRSQRRRSCGGRCATPTSPVVAAIEAGRACRRHGRQAISATRFAAGYGALVGEAERQHRRLRRADARAGRGATAQSDGCGDSCAGAGIGRAAAAAFSRRCGGARRGAMFSRGARIQRRRDRALLCRRLRRRSRGAPATIRRPGPARRAKMRWCCAARCAERLSAYG